MDCYLQTFTFPYFVFPQILFVFHMFYEARNDKLEIHFNYKTPIWPQNVILIEIDVYTHLSRRTLS